jgi:hypothetical protein
MLPFFNFKLDEVQWLLRFSFCISSYFCSSSGKDEILYAAAGAQIYCLDLRPIYFLCLCNGSYTVVNLCQWSEIWVIVQVVVFIFLSTIVNVFFGNLIRVWILFHPLLCAESQAVQNFARSYSNVSPSSTHFSSACNLAIAWSSQENLVLITLHYSQPQPIFFLGEISSNVNLRNMISTSDKIILWIIVTFATSQN